MRQMTKRKCRGGWPKSLFKAALRQVAEYYEAITRSAISGAEGVEKDEKKHRGGTDGSCHGAAKAVANSTAANTLFLFISVINVCVL